MSEEKNYGQTGNLEIPDDKEEKPSICAGCPALSALARFAGAYTAMSAVAFSLIQKELPEDEAKKVKEELEAAFKKFIFGSLGLEKGEEKADG